MKSDKELSELLNKVKHLQELPYAGAEGEKFNNYLVWLREKIKELIKDKKAIEEKIDKLAEHLKLNLEEDDK